MFDLEKTQRDGLADMMRGDELPMIPRDIWPQLEALGIALFEFDPKRGRLGARFPAGWRKVADVRPTTFLVEDERGKARLRVTWQAPLLFSDRPGHGSVEILPVDAYYRAWITDGARWWMDRVAVYRVGCSGCKMEMVAEVTADLLPGHADRIEADADRAFRARHPVCPLERRGAEPMGPPVAFIWPDGD